MGDTLRRRVVCDTTVRQLCLTSCLSDAHRAAVLDTLSPMVLDHHTARAWASDLLNTHLTCVGEQVLDEMKVWGTTPPPAPSQVDQVLKSIEQHAFRGFELNDTAIYQALVLVCKEPGKRQPDSLHQRAKRHNPLAETDCWSVMSTYKRWFEELLSKPPRSSSSITSCRAEQDANNSSGSSSSSRHRPPPTTHHHSHHRSRSSRSRSHRWSPALHCEPSSTPTSPLQPR